MKKALSVFSLLIVWALLLTAGCTPAAPAQSPAADTPAAPAEQTPAAPAEEAPAAPAEGSVELRFMWWGGDARHEATLAAIEKYTTDVNPSVKISAEYGGYDGYFQKLATQAAGGVAPDLIQMDINWFSDLMRQGNIFVELDKMPQINTTDFDEMMLESCMREGMLVGLPTGVIAEDWMAYNTEFFAKHGLDADPDLTWDSFIALGRQVHAADENDYLAIFGPDEAVMLYISQVVGGPFVTDDYTVIVTPDIAQQAFETLVTLYESGTLLPIEENLTGEVFESPKWLSGQIGLITAASSMAPAIASSAPFEIGETHQPLHANGKDTGLEVRPAQIMSIFNGSKHIDETAEFLSWFLGNAESAEILKDSRGIPANNVARDTLTDLDLFSPIVVAMTNKAIDLMGTPRSFLGASQEILQIITDISDTVAYGRTAPADAAVQLVDELNAKVLEMKP